MLFFIRIKHNMEMFWVIPFIKLQNLINSVLSNLSCVWILF